MARLIFRQWVSPAYRLRQRASAGLLCASLALGAAACGDAFGPRPRPTGVRPDSVTPDARLLWYEVTPRVIPLGQLDSLRVTVGVNGIPSAVQLSLVTGLVPLQRVSNGVWSGRVSANDLVFNYRTGDLRNTASFIEVVSQAGTRQSSVTVNVKDNTIPAIVPQTLSQTVQAASHVVNIRYDSLYLGGQVPPEVLRTFYQFFGDEYDFITVVEQVQSDTAPFYFAARNDVSGLGLQLFDRAGPYGSNTALDGILHFPYEADFDPADTGVLHELSHRWMNFSNLQSVRTLRPHWPISTLAQGINGYADAQTGERQIFRWEITPQPNQTYSVRQVAEPRAYNDFELYLLGLLPPDSVRPHIVFLNQNQRAELRQGGVLVGPTDTITVGEWVARDGVREPAYPATPRSFRMATIVLSRNGLLTRDDMSFYNALAMRAESETEMVTIRATTRVTSWPFFLATGGRGRLITRLRLNQQS